MVKDAAADEVFRNRIRRMIALDREALALKKETTLHEEYLKEHQDKLTKAIKDLIKSQE